MADGCHRSPSLSKARVVSLLNHSRPGEVPIATNDEIFQMAVEIVKFANLIQKNEPTAQWAWLCKSYKHRHAMAFILSELCIRPISPETNQACATISRSRKLESLRAPRDYHSSLPVPRSIIHRDVPVTAPATDLEIHHSSTSGSAGMQYLLDEELAFDFSAIDWLSGSLL
jgi:hypothetical protein